MIGVLVHLSQVSQNLLSMVFRETNSGVRERRRWMLDGCVGARCSHRFVTLLSSNEQPVIGSKSSLMFRCERSRSLPLSEATRLKSKGKKRKDPKRGMFPRLDSSRVQQKERPQRDLHFFRICIQSPSVFLLLHYNLTFKLRNRFRNIIVSIKNYLKHKSH